MTLFAADLQKKHLEGAPDPFPADPVPATAFHVTAPPSPLDAVVDADTAFPALGSSSNPSVSSSISGTAWGFSSGPRIRPSMIQKPVFTDSFTLNAIDLSHTVKDRKPITLGEVMKQVMAKYNVKIDASANQRARQTTFHLKADTQKDLDKAKRNLVALLSPVTTLVIQAPISTIPSIIGPKGTTLKQIRDQTSVRIDIPRRDSPLPAANGHTPDSHSIGVTSPLDDDDEPTVPVTLTGSQPLVYEAQALLKQIISSKTSKTTQRVRDIPSHVLPFILVRRPSFLAAAAGKDITLSLNVREITVSGDRDAVTTVVDRIKTTIDFFAANLTSLKLTLAKRQHRLLVGKTCDDIMAKSKCAIIVPDHDDPSEEVVVWGQSPDLSAAVGAVVESANAQHIHEIPIPGPIATSRQIITYMIRTQYTSVLASAHIGLSVFLPTSAALDRGQALNIDLVGEKPVVDAGVRQISVLIGKLIGATRELSIDWLVHRIVIGKHGKKLKQFGDVHNVQVFFPNESEEKSTVVLVYDPLSPSASPIPEEKKRHLDDVEKELLKLAKDAADVKTEKVAVETRWHEAVLGQDGTTLNALVGEDRTLSIKVGPEVGDPSTNDVILVRGTTTDVDKAVREILKIVEAAKNDEIVNSYSTEFDIDREFVGRIVGTHGAGVNRLREQLGVKVDVSDDIDDKEKEGSRKKKSVHQKSRVKITGRQENVEEAKRRILTHLERLADETTEVLKIPSQYHSSLIGQSGKYAIRLEERYSVKITFPRPSAENGENRTKEQLKPDEVLIKGGKKGVAGAKSELLEALEFEKESNVVTKFTVPSRCMAQILGKGGASINEIKDDTNTQIEFERADNVANVSIRGTKDAIHTAKEAILAIANQIPEETAITVIIDNKFHRSLIGPGGQGLKELVAMCGGPSDPKLLASLIKFPRPGEPSDEVKLRGDPNVVSKLKSELEKAVTLLRDRIIIGVEIPATQHRALIGRGGQNLNYLQDKFNVQIQFPGSRSYHQIGEPQNIEDLAEVDVADVAKVSGTQAACDGAIEQLKLSCSQIKPPPAEVISTMVTVPMKYYHAISQRGNFFRTLRSFGVYVEHPSIAPRPMKPPLSKNESSATPAARIDEAAIEDASADPEISWEVILNYQNADDELSAWTLKARDQASLERAKKLIEEAVDHASRMTHVGFLTLPDKSVFPRIVGTKGSNVVRLRSETKTDISVSRDDNTITIIGAESDVLTAKNTIIDMVASFGQSRDQASAWM